MEHKEPVEPTYAHQQDPVKIKPVTVGEPDLFGPLGTKTCLILWLDRLLQTELEEDGMRISLTVVDTPGFGDNIDNEARYLPLRPIA